MWEWKTGEVHLTIDDNTNREKIKRINIMWYHLRVDSKTRPKWHYLWNRMKDTESRLVFAKGEENEGEGWLRWLEVSRVQLVCIEWMVTGLLFSIGNYFQYLWQTIMEKNIWKNVYVVTTI